MAQKTLTLYPSSYDTTDYKYASVHTSYPLSVPIGKSSSNTSYAQINLTTGSQAETWVYYKFDTSAIPQDATIVSVSCVAKGYISQTNSSRITTRQIQAFSGTTAKGSASTLTSTATSYNMSIGTWTRAELNDFRVRLYGKRGTSNTTTNYYLRFYGATLTIVYNEVEKHDVTVTCNGEITANPTSAVVNGGGSFTTRIDVPAGVDFTATDNGTDIKSSLVKHTDYQYRTVTDTLNTTASTATLTSNASYISGTTYQNPIGRASTYTTTSQIRTTSSSYRTKILYKPDLSSIPEGAVIKSVQALVYCRSYSTSTNTSYTFNVALISNGTYMTTQAKPNTTASVKTYNADISKLSGRDIGLEIETSRYGGYVGGMSFVIEYEYQEVSAQRTGTSTPSTQ